MDLMAHVLQLCQDLRDADLVVFVAQLELLPGVLLVQLELDGRRLLVDGDEVRVVAQRHLIAQEGVAGEVGHERALLRCATYCAPRRVLHV